jgi:broad specificity phosphatase PhoE
MNLFYIIRHGETDFSQKNIVQGHSQNPLNKKGVATARKIGTYLSQNININKVFTSDLNRCIETSEVILEYFSNIKTYNKVRQLREINLGVFEGKHVDDLNRFRQSSNDYNEVVPPNGESINELTLRIKNWFVKNINILNSSLIVTHKGPISVILSNSYGNLNAVEKGIALKHGSILKIEIKTNLDFEVVEIIKA